jgi:hypothetical protein
VYWVGLGEDADILAAQRDLLIRLGAATGARSVSRAAEALRGALVDRDCLLLVDDVWSVAAARAFAVTNPRSRVPVHRPGPGAARRGRRRRPPG